MVYRRRGREGGFGARKRFNAVPVVGERREKLLTNEAAGAGDRNLSHGWRASLRGDIGRSGGHRAFVDQRLGQCAGGLQRIALNKVETST